MGNSTSEIENNIGIDSKTLLQVNATAIIGILFFLTLFSMFGGRAASLTSAFIFPFAASAIYVIFPKVSPASFLMAKLFTVVGFGCIYPAKHSVVFRDISIKPEFKKLTLSYAIDTLR